MGGGKDTEPLAPLFKAEDHCWGREFLDWGSLWKMGPVTFPPNAILPAPSPRLHRKPRSCCSGTHRGP